MTSDQSVVGLTQKELLLRVEGMLVTHIQQSQEAHNTFMATLAAIQERQAVHEADGHPVKVAELTAKETREEGRRDVLKYIFGASLLGLISGVAGIVFGLIQLLGG